MAEWIDEWRSKVVPLRLKHGFQVVGAWTVDGTDQSVWIVSAGSAPCQCARWTSHADWTEDGVTP